VQTYWGVWSSSKQGRRRDRGAEHRRRHIDALRDVRENPGTRPRHTCTPKYALPEGNAVPASSYPANAQGLISAISSVNGGFHLVLLVSGWDAIGLPCNAAHQPRGPANCAAVNATAYAELAGLLLGCVPSPLRSGGDRQSHGRSVGRGKGRALDQHRQIVACIPVQAAGRESARADPTGVRGHVV
jgi:hypothetical protein